MNPLLGIYSAVNHPNERECLTVEEALKLYTINAARLVFEESDKRTKPTRASSRQIASRTSMPR
ncbi:MAG: hypothetical protein M1598_01590 [Actinobacteria bacterium]|nr:hypothetical protein [Actinomycetota bacterium]